ncbi:MAG: alpha/beta hydrolase [Marmoricola sp.]|jgi:acetyl esterase/lipase|nr:alpha/beta hydrolase [Marmoricola sp.]
MARSYTVRQLVTAALTANAIRPLPNELGAASFFPGWLTNELAPQVLALTALDTAVQLKRGRAGRTGVLLATASAIGLGFLIRRATQSAALVEGTLSESLGADYLDRLERHPDRADLRTPIRDLARPFAMRKRAVQVIRNISYARGGRRAQLDIYRPRDTDLTDAPVLVQVHGGGWMIGNKEQQGQLLMNRMATRGWICVAVNYRLAPKHPMPAQIIDVKKALAWVRENIAEYGGDPSYVVITGGSAGGHLAALAALTPDVAQYQPGFEAADTSVSACVPFYGVYDLAGITGDKAAIAMRDRFLGPLIFKKDPKTDLADFELASPIAHITPDAPDFYVLHGEYDTLVSVKQARAFVEKLRAVSKATVLYSELPGTQHAWEVFSSIRSNHTIRAVERFLEWHRLTRREGIDIALNDVPAESTAG